MLKLELDAAAIERLLSHRAPLRLVDRVDGFAPGRGARLRAWLRLEGDEPVFAGHFPGAPIWPGAYLIEGVAQCAGLLLALQAIHERGGEAGLHALASATSGALASGLLARANVDFHQPVRPPALLRYEVQWAGAYAGLIKIDGHVGVEGKTVAKGSVTLVPGPLEPS